MGNPFDGIDGDDGTDGVADAAKVVDLYFSRYFKRLEKLAKKWGIAQKANASQKFHHSLVR